MGDPGGPGQEQVPETSQQQAQIGALFSYQGEVGLTPFGKDLFPQTSQLRQGKQVRMVKKLVDFCQSGWGTHEGCDINIRQTGILGRKH